jgi:hypothetical protein
MLVSALLALIDRRSGLMAGKNQYYFTGPIEGNAAASSSLMVLALRQLIPIARSLRDGYTALSYTSAADTLSTAINRELWNDELGTYSLSLANLDDFSITGIAFTILSGVANKTQAASSIAQLPLLKHGVGYTIDSLTPKTPTTQLSPNLLGFLLHSLFYANCTLGIQTLEVAKDLLDNFWSEMVTQNQYYSGASWEYMFPDASPGIGLYTSLSHPWGSAPSYLFPEYVLGIIAVEPGYKKWALKPSYFGLGLVEAKGCVPTPHGPVGVEWHLIKPDKLSLVLDAPEGTLGTVVLPFAPRECRVSGQDAKVDGLNIYVAGGSRVEITVLL